MSLVLSAKSFSGEYKPVFAWTLTAFSYYEGNQPYFRLKKLLKDGRWHHESKALEGAIPRKTDNISKHI